MSLRGNGLVCPVAAAAVASGDVAGVEDGDDEFTRLAEDTFREILPLFFLGLPSFILLLLLLLLLWDCFCGITAAAIGVLERTRGGATFGNGWGASICCDTMGIGTAAVAVAVNEASVGVWLCIAWVLVVAPGAVMGEVPVARSKFSMRD
jgi:hypothetical protein